MSVGRPLVTLPVFASWQRSTIEKWHGLASYGEPVGKLRGRQLTDGPRHEWRAMEDEAERISKALPLKVCVGMEVSPIVLTVVVRGDPVRAVGKSEFRGVRWPPRRWSRIRKWRLPSWAVCPVEVRSRGPQMDARNRI